MNERGGIWNYIEKPGWDFQMSSRVPLAGRATEPIATYTTGDVVPWKVSRTGATSSDGARTPRNRRRRDDLQKRVAMICRSASVSNVAAASRAPALLSQACGS